MSQDLDKLRRRRDGLSKRLTDARLELQTFRESSREDNSAMSDKVQEMSLERSPNLELLGHTAVEAWRKSQTDQAAEGLLVEEIHEKVHELNLLEQEIALAEAGFLLSDVQYAEQFVEVLGSHTVCADTGESFTTLSNMLIEELLKNNEMSSYLLIGYKAVLDLRGKLVLEGVTNSTDITTQSNLKLGIRLTSQYRMMLKETGATPRDDRKTLGAIIWYLRNYVLIQSARQGASEHSYQTQEQHATV